MTKADVIKKLMEQSERIVTAIVAQEALSKPVSSNTREALKTITDSIADIAKTLPDSETSGR